MSAPERIGRPDDPAVPAERLKRKTHAAVTGGGPAWRRYQDVVVGQRSLAATLYFEFCILLGPVPGALGLFLRKLFWPRLFGACGRGTVRHQHPRAGFVVPKLRWALAAQNPLQLTAI